MAFAGLGRGWNPIAGWDAGGLPPVSQTPGGYALPGMAGMPMQFHPGMAHPQAYGTYYGASGHPAHFPSVTASLGGPVPLPVFPSQPARYPNPHPVVNPDCPALNLQNSTGGAGCEPGYNYYFPAEHTKIHVIKSREAPWRVAQGTGMSYGAYHVPVNTTIGELMKGFGATNASPKKNRVTEVYQGGEGKWYKGLSFGGDDKDDCKRTLRSIGWDKTRTGRPGEKSVVWIWVTKD
jgi:hypothetical protein